MILRYICIYICMFWRTIQQSWAVSTFSSERQRLFLNLMAGKDCELCSARARLYCTSDAAFLCYCCDAHVHQANFLVARHCRELLCARCAAFAGRSFSGGGAGRRDSPLCLSCSVADHKPGADQDVSDSESSSLTCASSPCASSAASGGRGGGGRRRSGRQAEALETWCRRLGWGGRRRLAAAALRSLAAWRSAKSAAMPMRVGLAAALWYAAGRRGGGAAELGRLERLSGVPARVIVWAEGRVRKLMMRMKPINNKGPKDNEEEGWAEC